MADQGGGLPVYSHCKGEWVALYGEMGKSTSCFDIFPLSVENELLLGHEVARDDRRIVVGRALSVKSNICCWP